MPMRLSGLMSGMDTESLISQLVDAKGAKVKKAKKAQIKANWKQDAWKELNTKLKNLQSKYISDLRFASSYSKKTTKVSNPNAASVITGKGAVNSVQSLEITQLAKTGYLTGAELKGDNNAKGNYTALTTLGQLGVSESASGTFSVKTGSGNVDIDVNANTTISDVLTKLKDAGLNASFDTKTQRFFLSAKESGLSNDFSLTASNADGAAALSALGLQVSLNDDKATLAQYREYAGYYDKDSEENTLYNMRDLIDNSVKARKDSYLDQYKAAQKGIKSAQDKINEINEKYADKHETLGTAESYASSIDTKNQRLEELKAKDQSTLTDAEKAEMDTLKTDIADLEERKADAETIVSKQNQIGVLNDEINGENGIKTYINIDDSDPDNIRATATDKLTGEEKASFYAKAEYAAKVMKDYDPDTAQATGATKVSGQDAIIKLNGAEFTNATNVFDINGLTITALSETKEGESVTLTTQNDTDGIYDMVKNFLKEYNAIMNEMDKLYNATSVKSMEPLLSEEKEKMSETEVTEYEKKIKESILRNDSNISSISTALRGIMSSGFEVNGKKLHLSDFGINTLGYFNAADNEKNMYHIDGDPDDANTSGNEDVLRGMISSDPDTVISFFTQMAQSLYSKMSDMSKSVEGYRSFGSFYDDKKMSSDYNSYNSKIKDMEDKLNAYEDKWYKKFSKMETAMAKMQSKTSALSGILGGQ